MYSSKKSLHELYEPRNVMNLCVDCILQISSGFFLRIFCRVELCNFSIVVQQTHWRSILHGNQGWDLTEKEWLMGGKKYIKIRTGWVKIMSEN